MFYEHKKTKNSKATSETYTDKGGLSASMVKFVYTFHHHFCFLYSYTRKQLLAN